MMLPPAWRATRVHLRSGVAGAAGARWGSEVFEAPDVGTSRNPLRRCAMSHRQRARLLAGLVSAVTFVMVDVSPAVAQVPDPAPDGSLPGASLITQVLGWLKYASIA